MHGTIHAGAAASGAKTDLVTAYDDAAGRAPIILPAAELGGQTLVDGVYSASGAALSVNGTLTLDGQDDPNSTFIFQTNSTLITGSYSHVVLINGAQACKRLLAGRQFGDVGHDIHLYRCDPRPDLDYGGRRGCRRRSSVGTEWGRNP